MILSYFRSILKSLSTKLHNSGSLMETSDSAYYGRVMSVYMLNFSIAPIVMLPTGYLVDRFGVSATEMTVGIVLTVIMLLFLGFRNRFFLCSREHSL